eukprot:COSAG06_NODE_19322_length_843_cov_8.888441_1_plen_215_part_01
MSQFCTRFVTCHCTLLVSPLGCVRPASSVSSSEDPQRRCRRCRSRDFANLAESAIVGDRELSSGRLSFFVSATGGDLNQRPRPADAARVSWRDARTPGPPRARPVVCWLLSGCSSVQVQDIMDSGSAAAAAAAAAVASTAAETGSPAEQRGTTGARPWGSAGRPSDGWGPGAGPFQLGGEMDGSRGAPHATATRGEVLSPRGPSIPRARKGTPLS